MTADFTQNLFEGYLDRIDNGSAFGWAWRSDLPNDPIFVDLYIDDESEDTALASLYRGDLESAGKGNGQHAFELKLPSRCYDGRPHVIRLCYHGTAIDLCGSPHSLLFETKDAGYRLKTDESVRGTGKANLDAKPTVSVIIPCYNLGAYLDEAVQSVLNQSFQDFEIIIIDDGSTDPVTRHLFASYRRSKTRILRTEKQGLAKARNLGIKEAKGKYISCLDADDLLEPNFLKRTVAALEGNPDLAFASCWLKGVGESQFDWHPTSCDFPHLLVEDTVCTPALMRREIVMGVGGFDSSMPISGYEDWDLAISLVERGLRGTIVPEYLFKYRIRRGSMSASCTEPNNHALLMQYLVEKHAKVYQQHLAGVLEAIERRTRDLERAFQANALESSDEAAKRLTFVEATLRSILQSRNWRFGRPLRRGLSKLQRMRRALGNHVARNSRVAVVVSPSEDGEALCATVENLWFLFDCGGRLVLLDNGSSDPVIREMLQWYYAAGVDVVRAKGVGAVRIREIAFRQARAPILFAMDAGEHLEPGVFQRAVETLEHDRDLSFVCSGLRDEGTGFTWIPMSVAVSELLACPRMTFPMVRREAFLRVGGYDTSFRTPRQADWDLALRLAAHGEQGTVFPGALVYSCSAPLQGSSIVSQMCEASSVVQVVEKHRALFDDHWVQAVLGHENWRRQLQAHLESINGASPSSATPEPVSWGNLRRLQPVSRVWGLDRGQVIDRYYIERFLERNRRAIRGRVLEVKDAGYTQAYGSGVEASDVVDIAADNPSVTLICDLAAKGSLPENTYDCFILTQTIHSIYDIRTVVENAYRTLRPGGVLLATLPCVSRLDYESGVEGDCWRFTPGSARRLFEEIFGVGHVEVASHGNVLVCSSFLMGLASEDLTSEELNQQDPYFPLIVTVRAVKPDRRIASPSSRTCRQEKALVLVYHRIDRSSRDRWQLCVSPENFAAHLRCIRRCFSPVRLSEITAMLQDGAIRSGSVAVTFDDGYRDNLAIAMPVLKQARVPATFFISGDGASVDEVFWWERLDAALGLMEIDESDAKRLHQTLMAASVDERDGILAGLPRVTCVLPPRLSWDELKTLAHEPLSEIGAHGWSHRVLANLSLKTLRTEVMQNIATLTHLTGNALTAFAYPFGGPATAEVESVLQEAGIQAACTIADTAVTTECRPLAIPRIEVKDWDESEFEARLRSLLGQ